MKKTLQLSNIIALVVTIIMNYLSNTGVFNQSTMATVSAKYQNLFTPAGYAFSIWGLIYIGLIAFAIYQSQGLFNNKETPAVVEKIGWMFVISCIANCLWILAWLYDYTGASVIIMTVLLLSLCSIIIRTRMEFDLITFKRVALEWWPFAIYFGWITVAIIANVAAYLTKIQWDGFGISAENWTITMILAAMLINLFVTWNRNLRESASVGVWALIAVAVANWEVNKTVAYTAIAASVVIFISCGAQSYKNKGKAFII
ncbi:tryptophan-rich sensory protein [Dyadobacter subterraneus]|uniref:Tryptophan-rich sensory protein n=1 Tax=Dyadobacter subterraneus TaxID=2773304 RepID=A0ABR9WBG8_9BACT|nr:tryptophan-rich sensory protein [Dyadobacter subterraneus]MBE9461554.1 tryptophan-rich sensory protein [Dyadobacter subterraneus]